MTRLYRTLIALAGVFLAIVSPAYAAQPDRGCGITGASTASSVDYDPFDPNGLGTTNVTLTLTRLNPGNGNFTRSVYFYLQSPTASANGTEVIPISYTGAANVDGLGLNIFYDFGLSGPNLTGTPTPSSANRFFLVDFTGGNEGSDSIQVNFTIRLPANLDVAANTSLGFDVLFRCLANPNTDLTSSIASAITFPVRILSALQASFAGPALDFGEVGDKTDAQITSTPIVKTGNVRVASSGVFTVEMTSQNGYKMTFPGGSLTNSAQTLRYQAKFLGQTRSPTATTAITKTCGRAGVPLASGQLLPIEVKLLDGGSTRTAAPLYTDNLIVTLSPVTTPSSATTCVGL